MRVTIADVARQAGVGKTTVSRVLNGKDDVDPRTADRIRQIITETGYVRNARAVGLARGSTQTVGMLVSALTWPWMAYVVQGVIDALEPEGYGLLLYTLSRGERSLAQFARQVSSAAFDGLVVIEPPNTLDYIEQLHRSGLPVVLIDDRGHHPDFPSVATTNHEGAALAAGHLADSGRRALAMISGPAGYGCTRDRADGFARCARERGVPLDPRLITGGDFSEDSGYLAAQRLVAAGVPFDAVFAHNDDMAIGALRRLRESGRRIPADVAVVGFDDIALAARTEPPLTTVHQPLQEMGAGAARMMISRLNGDPDQQQRLVLATSLVVRDSG